MVIADVGFRKMRESPYEMFVLQDRFNKSQRCCSNPSAGGAFWDGGVIENAIAIYKKV